MKPERKLSIPGSSSDQPMLSRSEVESLMEREAQPESPVLSVYLDTNQADAVNVSRGFEVVFRNMLRDVKQPEDKNKRNQLKEDAERVLRFLDDYRDTKRALVIFTRSGCLRDCERSRNRSSAVDARRRAALRATRQGKENSRQGITLDLECGDLSPLLLRRNKKPQVPGI